MVGNGTVAGVEPIEDRGLARQSVPPELGDPGVGVLDRWTVAGEEPRLRPCHQLVERSHVVAHLAVGRRDDGGRPSHDVIAGEGEVAAP